MWTLSFLIILSLALGLGAWLFFLWSVKSGHYDDIERPKHRMLDDDDDADGNARSGRQN
jgi:cbb3-type cytochrome oxidase maturation protein